MGHDHRYSLITYGEITLSKDTPKNYSGLPYKRSGTIINFVDFAGRNVPYSGRNVYFFFFEFLKKKLGVFYLEFLRNAQNCFE